MMDLIAPGVCCLWWVDFFRPGDFEHDQKSRGQTLKEGHVEGQVCEVIFGNFSAGYSQWMLVDFPIHVGSQVVDATGFFSP